MLFRSFALLKEQKTLVVNSPSDNDGQKEFLGYKWNKRKGSEGITIIKEGGKLYNHKDRFDENTLSSCIRKFLTNSLNKLNDEQAEFSYILETVNMLDFSKIEFDFEITSHKKNTMEFNTKFDLVELGKVCEVLIGGTPSRKNSNYFTGKNLWVSISEMKGNVIYDTKEKITDDAINDSNVKLIPKGTTLLSFKLSIGKTAIAGVDLYTNEAIAGLIPKEKSSIDNKYLFHLFNSRIISLDNVGNKVFGKSLNSTYIKESMKIPVPPIHIQKEIIKECDEIDNIHTSYLSKIEEYQESINELITESIRLSSNTVRLEQSDKFDIFIGRRMLESEVESKQKNNLIPIYSANVFEPFGYTDKKFIDDFNSPSILWGIDGDWQVNYIEENIEFYPTDHCGVIRVKSKDINLKYLSFILRENGKNKFSRTYRASTKRIQALSLDLPDLDIQNKVIEEINVFEKKILDLNNKIKEQSEIKRNILNKYLK